MVLPGDSFTDRVVAVGVGYCVVAALLWWLFQSKARWTKAACAEIQPAVTVFKLGVFSVSPPSFRLRSSLLEAC